MQPSFIISGGGTGGHIYPALSIADALKRKYPDAKIHFVGAKGRMEMEKVPAAGYPISGLWISGIQRKLSLKNLMFPFKLISSLWKAIWIIKKHKPSVVIGTGGFASGPTLYVAARMGIPTLIQEQNSYPGITNRWLSSKVKKICVAYEGLSMYFPSEKIEVTGNPVRKDLENVAALREQSRDEFKVKKDAICILILGGSLGAKAINDFVQKNLIWFQEHEVELIWQTGKHYYKACQAEVNKLGIMGVKVHPFIADMPKAFACADVVISRAGAGTISELCLVGVCSIIIPSPNVAEDHQTRNGAALVKEDAAIMVKESEIQLRLLPVIKDLSENKEKRNYFANNIKKLAKPQADEDIVKYIEELIEA